MLARMQQLAAAGAGAAGELKQAPPSCVVCQDAARDCMCVLHATRMPCSLLRVGCLLQSAMRPLQHLPQVRRKAADVPAVQSADHGADQSLRMRSLRARCVKSEVARKARLCARLAALQVYNVAHHIVAHSNTLVRAVICERHSGHVCILSAHFIQAHRWPQPSLQATQLRTVHSPRTSKPGSTYTQSLGAS
jgi:hypothetical protein